MATTLTIKDQEYIPAKWEEVNCPFCNSGRHSVLEHYGYQHRYTYVRCKECGLAFQSPRPAYTSDFVETAYEVYDTSTEKFETSQGLTEQGKVVYAEYSHVLSEIEVLLSRPGRLLEIGCNTGFFGKVALDRKWTLVGVEISETMAKAAHANYGFETRAGDWTKMSFNLAFDAVYCSHVIEHIPNPQEWMKKFKEVIQPKGIVCLSVPNMNSFDRRFKRVLKKLRLKKDKWQKWRTPDHLYEPCHRSMHHLFEVTGFELVKEYTYPSEWDGRVGFKHWFYHQFLKAGAKARYFIRLKQG